MRLELGKGTLLRPPAFMEGDHLTRACLLVGGDGLDLCTRFNGSEQPGSDRRLVLASDLLPDEYEAMAGIPRLRLSTDLETIDFLRRAAPLFSAFDQALEGGKAPERCRNGALDLQRIQLFGDGSVDEGAIDAGLDTCAGKARAHLARTAVDEGAAPLESRTFPGR